MATVCRIKARAKNTKGESVTINKEILNEAIAEYKKVDPTYVDMVTSTHLADFQYELRTKGLPTKKFEELCEHIVNKTLTKDDIDYLEEIFDDRQNAKKFYKDNTSATSNKEEKEFNIIKQEILGDIDEETFTDLLTFLNLGLSTIGIELRTITSENKNKLAKPIEYWLTARGVTKTDIKKVTNKIYCCPLKLFAKRKK